MLFSCVRLPSVTFLRHIGYIHSRSLVKFWTILILQRGSKPPKHAIQNISRTQAEKLFCSLLLFYQILSLISSLGSFIQILIGEHCFCILLIVAYTVSNYIDPEIIFNYASYNFKYTLISIIWHLVPCKPALNQFHNRYTIKCIYTTYTTY